MLLRARNQTEMTSRRELANSVLLSNLRRAVPHASLPSSTRHTLPDQELFWWPLTNKWAMALDDALRRQGLAPLSPDCDPDARLQELL